VEGAILASGTRVAAGEHCVRTVRVAMRGEAIERAIGA
jgi:hypothetical protein